MMLYRPIRWYERWTREIQPTRLMVRLAEWYRLNEAGRRLARLDDRLLSDIGLARDEIAERVQGRPQA